jgi:hypothetical protein
VLLLVALLAPAPGVGAEPDEDDLRHARQSRDRAVAEARALSDRAGALADRYRRMEAATGRTTARLVDALMEELRVGAEVAEARELLGRRANAAYRAGPGTFVMVFLESSSPADFLATRELLERTVFSHVDAAAEILSSVERTRHQRRDLELQKARLLRRQRALGNLRQRVEARLREAEAAAKAARIRLASLEAARRRVTEAAAAAAAAISALEGIDQTELLQLLGSMTLACSPRPTRPCR